MNIRDSDIGSNHYKLALGEVSPITSDGSRVFVEIIDSRTDKTTDEINVGLISVENVDDSHSKFLPKLCLLITKRRSAPLKLKERSAQTGVTVL